MNASQLATLSEAREMAPLLMSIGGGVKDIFRPDFLGPYSSGGEGGSDQYYFRFANGAEVNAGLVRTLIERLPGSWPNALRNDVEYGRKIVGLEG